MAPLMESLLVTLHVMANLVWIGAIASVGWLTRHAGALAEGKDRDGARAVSRVAYELLYKRVAAPAFGISFLCGLGRLFKTTDYYMHAHWFHAKLLFAFLVIGLHHVLGARARRVAQAAMADGSMQGAKVSGILTGALLASAFITVVLVVFQASLLK